MNAVGVASWDPPHGIYAVGSSPWPVGNYWAYPVLAPTLLYPSPDSQSAEASACSWEYAWPPGRRRMEAFNPLDRRTPIDSC